jgi:hypothetical protein
MRGSRELTMSRSLRWALMLLVLTAAVVVVVVAVVQLLPDSRTDVTDLEVGDCFVLDLDESGTVDLVDVVRCTSPHDAEVVLVTELNPTGDTPYPADDELFALAEARCGEFLADPAFGVVAIAPTAATWEGRAGRSLCVAVAYGDELVTVPYGAGPRSAA